MAVQNLENLFLRPQATDVSYGYIEGIITERIKLREWGCGESVDKFADLIDLLSSCLYRAGSGWVMVQTHRILNQIILPTLCVIDGSTTDMNGVLAGLCRLLDAHPILLRCKAEVIFQQCLRILKASKIPSPALMAIVSSISEVYRVPVRSVQGIVAQALAFLATAKDRTLVISCLSLIERMIDFIARDAQVLRSTLGLVSVARSSFMEDSEVRRLCSSIEGASYDSGETESDSEETESAVLTAVEPTNWISAEPRISGTVKDDAMPEVDSPRSSCPSLDF